MVAVQSKFDKNDQLSSNSTPMVHNGAALLAKNQVLLAKREKKDSLSIQQHVLTILKIRSNTHPSRFVVFYSGCHQGSTSTTFIASCPPLLLCFNQILVDY